MKKNHFIVLLVSVVAGLLFSLGMCMCLLPEWNAFVPGVVLAAIGGVSLLALGMVALIKSGIHKQHINWVLVGKIAYGVVSALVMGLGMCLIMVWNLFVVGIIIGVVGIVMLLFLIPMFLGFKN